MHTLVIGIIKINVWSFSINNLFIAGSSKYATAEVLPASKTEKKTESNILSKYLDTIQSLKCSNR